MADVAVAYLHPAEVGYNFMASLLGTVMHDLAHDGRIGEVLPEGHGTPGSAAAGDADVRRFGLGRGR